MGYWITQHPKDPTIPTIPDKMWIEHSALAQIVKNHSLPRNKKEQGILAILIHVHNSYYLYYNIDMPTLLLEWLYIYSMNVFLHS